MTIAQFNCFLTVVEQGSYAKAANALFISQPAISKTLTKLEEELGFSLLERRNGVIQTTKAGEMLYNFCRSTKRDYQLLISDIHEVLESPSDILRIGCPDTWDPSKFFPRIKACFKTNHPSVKLQIEAYRLPVLLSRLQTGKVDLIMTHEFYPSIQPNPVVLHMTDTGCGILYANEYFKNITSLNDLKNVDFLLYDLDIEKKIAGSMKHILNKYGYSPRFRTCGSFSSTFFSLLSGDGIMMFTDWDSVTSHSSCTYLPLGDTLPVNLIFSENNPNKNISVFAQEIVGLFAKK